MTSIEKAKELVEKFYQNAPREFGSGRALEHGKQCALIAVEEILAIIERLSDIEGNHLRLTESGNYGDAIIEHTYWIGVKDEINKL